MCLSMLQRSWPHGLRWKRDNPDFPRTDPMVDVRAWKIFEECCHCDEVRCIAMGCYLKTGCWLKSNSPNHRLMAKFDAEYKQAPALYPCGFHAYLNERDARANAMSSDLILEVRMREIVALGYEWGRDSLSSSDTSLRVIVARSMFIVPEVKPFVLQ